MQDFDETDKWAEQFTRWKEFSKAHNLTRDRRVDFRPTCYKCKGFGKVFKNIHDLDSITDCPKCKGNGNLPPKPKYSNEEIREVVDVLGPDKVRELVEKYRKERKK